VGDTYRRARAYPRAEGQCPLCKRWLNLRSDDRLPRHLCLDGYDPAWRSAGTTPLQVYRPRPLA
jgi:hypothetical protein